MSMKYERKFSPVDGPYHGIQSKSFQAEIKGEGGKVVFQQEVLAPDFWSQRAVNIVAQKYLYGDAEKGEREESVFGLVDRVAFAISAWAMEDGYLDGESAKAFSDDLRWLLIHQYGSFNSPVWFNVGLSQALGVKGDGNGYRATKLDAGAWVVSKVRDSYEYPQASACFIQSVADDMESLTDLMKSEAMLFKYGSGTGTDLSTIRSSREKLSGGGKPSGPVSFLKIYDTIAGAIKSGGKTRRAAKMNTLKVGHPDILEFIRCKAKEEKKAKALIEAGFNPSFDGEAYQTVAFQNVNISIRATDEFMQRATKDLSGFWKLKAVTSGEQVDEVNAIAVLDEAAQAAWECGDPGIQYEDTIQAWHTCSNTGPINSSNPCSEYMFLDDSACNLSSLNLMKFRGPDGYFQVGRFRCGVICFLLAQEVLVGRASYPTEEIALNSARFRPLGLGYANLGSLLMSLGLPYDSDEGRDLAAAITALMHNTAYWASAGFAAFVGVFDGFAENRDPMLKVIEKHQDATKQKWFYAHSGMRSYEVWAEAAIAANEAVDLGRLYGYRNAQVTVLAPTGTIAFMMDCDTTGIEPAIALVSYKTLAGGGVVKMVNGTVPQGLASLGYMDLEIDEIVTKIDTGEVIGLKGLVKDEHLSVFDCALPDPTTNRSIPWRAHVEMMAAVQPFLSGAISKTINMPSDATPADIREAYVLGWKLGLKALAVYRDGCKGSQPVNVKKKGDADVGSGQGGGSPGTAEVAGDGGGVGPEDVPVLGGDGEVAGGPGGGGADGGAGELLAAPSAPVQARGVRIPLPETRNAVTHKFEIQGHEGYINIGYYDDGSIGEVFITGSKEGSTVSGLLDSLAIVVSLALQHGTPVDAIITKLRGQRFEPSGFTRSKEIRNCSSLADYLAQLLEARKTGPAVCEIDHSHAEAMLAWAKNPIEEHEWLPGVAAHADGMVEPKVVTVTTGDGCPDCGGTLVQTGKCQGCPACGFAGGCG